MGEKDIAASTRAPCAYDGVTVKVPDFADQYQKRIRIDGNHLLWSDGEGKTVTVQLYDIRAGKTLWKKDFSIGSVVMKSEDPDLVGAMDVTGKFKVFSISQNKELLSGQLNIERKDKDGKPLESRPQAVYLLRDANYFFVMVNGPHDPSVVGSLATNLLTNVGLRALPVNGDVACYKLNGQWVYNFPVQDQTLFLDQFAEMPMLLFTANYNKSVGDANMAFRGRGGMGANQVSTLKAFEKRTGKILCDEDFGTTRQNFHSLVSEPANRRIELRGLSSRIVFPYELPRSEVSVPVGMK